MPRPAAQLTRLSVHSDANVVFPLSEGILTFLAGRWHAGVPSAKVRSEAGLRYLGSDEHQGPYLQLQGQRLLVQQPLVLNKPVIFLLGFALSF